MTVYSLKSRDLTNLGPQRSVEFFRKLLWAEADRIGIGRQLISSSDAINVPDGGLDAIVENPISCLDSFLPKGISGFQIKTSNLGPTACQKELHEKGDLSKPLKPKVKWLLDNDGTYFLILFVEMPNIGERKDFIINDLKKCGYKNPKVEVYVINNLLGLAERFVSLIAYLKPYVIQGLSYEKWKDRGDVTTPENFIVTPEIEGIMEDIKDKVTTSNGTAIIRLLGLPGIGKTRLAFESLSDDDIKNKVVYVDAEAFKSSSLCRNLETDGSLEAIIVADECSPQTHEDFVRRFSNKGKRLSLITISHEITDIPFPTLLYKLEPLDTQNIKEIISKEISGLPSEVIDRIAKFSGGYLRIALLLAQNYSLGISSKEDILNLSDENLVNRLIADTNDHASENFRLTKKVLTSLSLFEKVWHENRVYNESKWLSEFFKIDYDEFRRIVKEQKRRSIIQGKFYIYVTPAVLAVHLTKEWIETIGSTFDFDEFVKKIPDEFRGEMVNRFTNRFPYITSVKQGAKLVKNLLSNRGIFADGKLLKNESNANLFLKLTEGDPESALKYLKNTVGTWSKEELLNFKSERRQVVWALERIVIWKRLFADGARLLLALGEAENESYANNASGIFAGLFAPAPGRVSTTEASPDERFPILVEAINSESIERKKLALEAASKALETRDFTRTVGAEYQGCKNLPELWIPKNYDAVFNYYKRVWSYLDENLEHFEEDVRNKAIQVMLDRASGIANTTIQNSRMVIKTIEKINSNSWRDIGDLLDIISLITYYDAPKMPEELANDWVNLEKEITGSGFSNLIKRFVGTDIFTDDEEEEWLDSKIHELALQIINDPNLIVPEYSWLTTSKAKRGFKFGYELGKLDEKYLFIDEILKHQNKDHDRSFAFLGGYLNGLSKINKDLVENKLILLSKDNFFQIYLPELAWRSIFNDKIGLIILELAEEGKINVKDLEIFRYGKVIAQISPEVFSRWINSLLKEQSHHGAIVALHLTSAYYWNSKMKLDKDLTFELLLHPVFWENPKKLSKDQMVLFHWKEVAVKLINQHPETEYLISKQLIEYFGDERSLFISPRSEIVEILLNSIKKNPKKLWELIKEYIGPPIDDRAFYLTRWLKDQGVFEREGGALELFNPEDIWTWVEEDLENRAWYLATFIPPGLYSSKNKTCIAREFLVIYGDREDVREEFSKNYSSVGFVGSMVGHYKGMKKHLLDFKEDETNENVIKWIDEYIENLDETINEVTLIEEREGWSF